MLKKQTDMSSQVKMVIMNRVRDERLSLQLVADELFMSARTLQRKLEREGTSFQILLDEVRQELAEDYLLRLGMSGTDTAFLVGLSEPSAFVRSFKRWTGLSPKEYQIQHKKKTAR
jgi:AraC-like DNA-binding protein